MTPRTIVPLLLAAAMAVTTACTSEHASARIPTAAEATAPVTVAPAALAAAANTIGPLDAKDEIGRTMEHFLSLKSYHVDMDSSAPKGRMTMDVDFVAPDRYRMKTPMGTHYVIGDTMYMTMNGRTTKMPLPKGQMMHYRDPARFQENRASMTVRSLGTEAVDGQVSSKYLIINTQPARSESTLWVGADGYPLRIEVTGEAGGQRSRTSIRYSRFNDPALRVDPPQ